MGRYWLQTQLRQNTINQNARIFIPESARKGSISPQAKARVSLNLLVRFFISYASILAGCREADQAPA
jgi:hypothetical protein